MDKVKILLCAFLAFTPVREAVYAMELSLHGFMQGNYSARAGNSSPYGAEQGNLILGEERIQLKGSFYPSSGSTTAFIKGDFYHDWVEKNLDAELREGYIDIAGDTFGLRAGRQIYTWGTGDLLFINDVFPKNWQAFYSGRPLEYLKTGVDSAKIDIYSGAVSAEIIVIPFFEPDTLTEGTRFHNPEVPPNSRINEPSASLENTEYAFRIYGNIADIDASAYFYRGFFRGPGAHISGSVTPYPVSYFYPSLRVYGVSAQKNALGGIISAEYGFYDSAEDRDGTVPGVENSQSRFLAGYQKALKDDLNIGVQYYAELMHNYGSYKDTLPSTFYLKKKIHQYITMRITKLLKYQTLKLSFFIFYSPDDRDFMAIPEASYNITDNLKAVLGADVFGGENTKTPFGRHSKDSNIYITVRRSF